MVKAICAVIISLSLLLLAITFGPVIETRHFPVYRDFRILSMTEQEPGVLRVVASFTKVRDCEPAGYAWFRGSRDMGTFDQIEVRSVSVQDGSGTGRPMGPQTSSPFEVHATLEEMENVFVNIFHRCPFQPWVTRTEAYP